MDRRIRCFKIGVMVVVGIAALGGLVMALWNWLLPTLFVGANPIGYAQALGLLLLCKILFGGFHGPCRRFRHRPGHPFFHHGEPDSRLENLTPEERDRLRNGLRFGRCR